MKLVNSPLFGESRAIKSIIFVSMEHMIELFAALGERLRHFGDDAPTRKIALAACRANEWFSFDEVCRSLQTLATEMLRPEKLKRWLAAYPHSVKVPRRILVVMAGNIPAVGFFDLLCVVCSGHICLYKPSKKDTILIDYIVGELRALDSDISIERYEDSMSVDAIIATGNNNTERYFRTRYAGIPMLLRGSRQSVAVLSGHETLEQLAGLADDIWAYSGLGCRNVSLIFVPLGYDLQLPMPNVNSKYKNNYIQTKALLQMEDIPFCDLGSAVIVEQSDFPKSLSELAIVRYRTLDEATTWLKAHDREIQCVVTDCLPHSRRTAFGQAQSPALTDWPDGEDVLSWLHSLA